MDILKVTDLLHKTLDALDQGIILIDRNDSILYWNQRVGEYTGKKLEDSKERDLFSIFPELPRKLLTIKFKGIRQLNTISTLTWEQKPALFNFPIRSEMKQNCTFIPVEDEAHGNCICITISDTTDCAQSIKELYELKEINKNLEVISNYDALTNIFNRRYILEALREQIEVIRDTKSTMMLVMFDLDHFKKVNDTYGHIVGDRVLKYVADTVSAMLLPDSFFGRYGGEEFLLFITNTTMDIVLQWTEDLRKSIHDGFVGTREGELHISASFGISTLDETIKDDLELIHKADVALYKSKEEGRNRITLL